MELHGLRELAMEQTGERFDGAHRGEDVVYQGDTAQANESIRLCQGKSPAQIALPLGLAQALLGRGVANALQRGGSHCNAKPLAQLPRQHQRLVVATVAQAAWMERDRQQELWQLLRSIAFP